MATAGACACAGGHRLGDALRCAAGARVEAVVSPLCLPLSCAFTAVDPRRQKNPRAAARLPPAIVPTVCRVPCAACTRRAHVLLRCARVGCPWPRRYDAHKVTPKYAFGHGLSYTAFDYSALSVSGLNVTFTVKNTGTAAGAEIPQMYLGFPVSDD